MEELSIADSYPQPFCPQCGEPLRLIPHESQWFCDNCKKYVDILPLSHVSIKGTKEGKREFNERFILMLILVAVLSALGWLIYYLLLSQL